MSCSTSLRCRPYPPDLPSRLYASGSAKTNEEEASTGECSGRHKCNPELFVTTTAGEDETPEGNPGKKWRCGWGFTPGISAWSIDVTSSSRTSNTWTGSSRIIPTLDNPTNRSLSLSARHMANRTVIGTWPSELSPWRQKGPFAISSENSNSRILSKNTNFTMHILGLWKSNCNGSASHHLWRSHIVKAVACSVIHR